MADIVSVQQNTPSDNTLNQDCLLIVGPEMIEIEANSLFLSAASEPFRAMFRPEWRTSDDITTQAGLVAIPLPEDDPTALQLICAVIQHQNHTIPHILPVDTVLSLAVTADKYDCSRALRFASETWLHSDRNAINDLFILAAAAYLLENATAFRNITKKMILLHNGPFAAVSCRDVEAVMDWRMLGKCAASYCRPFIVHCLIACVQVC